MAIMTARRVRHLPVNGDDELLGIVSIGDLVKSIISDREFAIEQLEHYIRGPRCRLQSDDAVTRSGILAARLKQQRPKKNMNELGSLP